MKTPQKHAALIKAWADGVEIEVKALIGEWHEIKNPTWERNTEYRIKPVTKPDVVQNMSINACGSIVYLGRFAKKANLKLIWDGETGALKSAEVIDENSN